MNTPDAALSLFLAEWESYQSKLIQSVKDLSEEELDLKPFPKLRSLRDILTHLTAVRARWFFLVMGAGGEEFKRVSTWDKRGRKAKTLLELLDGLQRTFQVMRETIQNWTDKDWERTWPGEYRGEPEIITPYWVVWHLIEHDLHHGGEISIMLGLSGKRGIQI
jgi:uncharacterized damage-inducible protein DinB